MLSRSLMAESKLSDKISIRIGKLDKRNLRYIPNLPVILHKLKRSWNSIGLKRTTNLFSNFLNFIEDL